MTLKGHNIFKSVWIISTLALLTSAPVAADAEEHAAIDSGMIRDHTVPLVQTPAQFKPRRQAGSFNLEEGKEITLFDAEGPGCLRHFWMTTNCAGDGLRIRIHVDDAEQPQVDMELNHFFGILLGKKPYKVESPGIKVLPLGSRNCYLPIPFAKSCRITLKAGDIKGNVRPFDLKIIDADPKKAMVMVQANWQKYDEAADLTPYRLHAHFHEERPAQSNGNYYMADITGKGFVAGMFKAIAQREAGDLLYHTGGGTWLIDGETDPNAFRGFNEEDDFNFSWGFFPYSSQWSGCPHVVNPGPKATEFVVWRFHGPDPVPFQSSLVLHFGSRADDTQSVIYYYKVPDSAPNPLHTPESWQVLGPYDATSFEKFDHAEEAESIKEWPEKLGKLPRLNLKSRHGWVDPRPDYRRLFPLWKDYAKALIKENPAMNLGDRWPVGVAVYMRGTVEVPEAGEYHLRFGHDDWLKIWVNGEYINTLRHEKGFDVAAVQVKLQAGTNEIMLKLNNMNNLEYRLWALNFSVVPKTTNRPH
jgi:hypothetical protein